MPHYTIPKNTILKKFASVVGLCAFLLTGMNPLSSTARADEVYTFVIKKQEEKAKNRWSLSEWLATRDRMRLMDMWLAMNSPSPYEFYLGAGSTLPGAQVKLGAFASIFGIEGSYEKFPDLTRWQALFKLRVFGFHQQATNITLHAGFRENQTPAGERAFVFGGEVTLYLAKYFGIDWSYLRINAIQGSLWDAGAFIDFRFLRLYGKYRTETGLRAENGPELGVRIFF